MSIDLSKLTPPPVRRRDVVLGDRLAVFVDGDPDGSGMFGAIAQFLGYFGADARTNADFYVLARNAFDVMMRRGWGVERHVALGGWWVRTNSHEAMIPSSLRQSDPFTALIEADRWMAEKEKANVQAR